MPTRLSHGRYPRLTAFASEKPNNGTYDMNDESQTDQSYPESPLGSTSIGKSASMEDASANITHARDGASVEHSRGYRSMSTGSFDSLVLSEDEAKKSKVSWSDSEGSTYVSDNEQANIDVEDFGEEAPVALTTNNMQGQPKDQKTKISEETFPRLVNVAYYSDIATATSSDEVSDVEFLSKEATREVFERRIVPLEVPSRQRRLTDDVSGFTSMKETTNDPNNLSGSFSALPFHTNRAASPLQHKTTKKQLKNVDYLSKIEVATNEHEISTTTYRVPRRVAAAAFHRQQVPKKISAVVMKDDEISLVTLPKSMIEISTNRRNDSLSTLGSASVMSDVIDKNDMSFEENESCEAARMKQPAAKETYVVNPGPAAETKRTNSHRIQSLKERIRKMQDLSSLEMATTREANAEANSKKKIAKKSSSRNNSRNFHVPPVVTREQERSRDDDISTIDCELHPSTTEGSQLIDVELGCTATVGQQNQNQRTASDIFKGGYKRIILVLGKADIALAQFTAYQHLQRLWARHLQDRSPTEKGIIAAVSLSCLVLFILFLSIATG